MKLRVRSLALLSGLRIGVAMSCGVGCRCGLDPTLLWLWHRPVATALIRPLAWEHPYAVGVAVEKAKRQKKIVTKKQMGPIKLKNLGTENETARKMKRQPTYGMGENSFKGCHQQGLNH